MSAVWIWTRSELRRGLRSFLALALLLGMFGGVVLASAAGARRTDSAYDRFAAFTHEADAFVGTSGGSPTPVALADLQKVAKLPQVAHALVARAMSGVALGEDGALLWGGNVGLSAEPPEGERGFFRLLRPKILAGRLPDPSRIDEVAVGYNAHQDPHIRLGAGIDLKVLKAGSESAIESLQAGEGNVPPSAFLPPLRLKVVGLVVSSGELQGFSEGEIFLTPAFYRAYVDRAATFGFALVWLRNGARAIPSFGKALDTISPGLFLGDLQAEAGLVHRSTHLQAIALRIFAILAGLAGALIFGQALARQMFLESRENPTLRSLGMTPRQLAGVALLLAALIALVGSILSVLVAVALSPLMPVGLARLAEPHPGLAADGAVLGLGLPALIALVMILALGPAWRASRVRSDQRGADDLAVAKRSFLASSALRTGVPSASAGVNMALATGRGRAAVPVRSAVAGATVAIIGLAAAFTYGTSFRHLVHTPRLYGHDFDLTAGSLIETNIAPRAVPILRSDPAVRAFAGGNLERYLQVGGGDRPAVRVNVWAFDPITGSVHPTVDDGRWPSRLGEIALGAKTLRAIHARVGQTISVGSGNNVVHMRVVGRAVFPAGFGPGLGEGAGMTYRSLRRFISDAPEHAFLVRLVPGADAGAAARRLNSSFSRLTEEAGAFGPTEGTDIVNLKEVEGVPLLLAGLLILGAAGTLAHTLVTSVRRRRRDLAILKTIGFVGRQVSGAVAWQASTLITLALLIGLPLGIGGGRWGWTFFADQLGVVPAPSLPVLAVALAAPAALALANLIAFTPGRVAARTQPAIVLRTE